MDRLTCSECKGRSFKNIHGVLKECIRCRGNGAVTLDRYVNLHDDYWPSQLRKGKITADALDMKQKMERARIEYLSAHAADEGPPISEDAVEVVGSVTASFNAAAPVAKPAAPEPDWLKNNPPTIASVPPPELKQEIPVHKIHKAVPVGDVLKLPFAINARTKGGDEFTLNCSLATAIDVLKAKGFVLAALKVDK